MKQIDIKYLIAQRPKEQRIWMVRASGGLFTETFSAAGLMAIGHVDDLNLRKGKIQQSDLLSLDVQLKKSKPDRTGMSITSHVNQTKKFCNEINVNDLIVTVDSASLMIGKVQGQDAYIDKTPVVVEHALRSAVTMPYHLRRDVIWGPKLPRSVVPMGLEMTLQAHQTVLSLDSHWEAVYHLLYPCFQSDGVLYLSANIQQKNALDNYSLTQFFGLLSGIEVIAKALVMNDSAMETSYRAMLKSYPLTHQMLLTSKAEFMSPGTIWSKVKMTPSEMAAAAMIYCMIFGGDMTVVKTDGILDKEMRHKIFDLVTELIKEHRLPELKENLKIDVPKLNTEPLDGNEENFSSVIA